MSTTSSGPSSSSPAGGGGGGGGGPCGACKFLRRKCVGGCIFAPYFDSEQGSAQFAAVHKVFGASNVSKLLNHVPAHRRLDAVITICYEAQARLRDPVYGCVTHIFSLQQQVVNLQAELSYLHAHLAAQELPTPPPAPPQQSPLSIADLPVFSAAPATYDLSTLFDPMEHPSWSLQYHRGQEIEPPPHFPTSTTPPSEVPSSAATRGGNLLNRHEPPVDHPCRNLASNLPPHSS